MPENRAPGDHTDETLFPSRTIHGLSTSIAGFVGPAHSGPMGRAQVVTSVADFARLYGDGRPLLFDDGRTMEDFLWHAVRGFFAEGGTRAYIVRTPDTGGRPATAAYETALHALEDVADT
jgi:hypothetical protein